MLPANRRSALPLHLSEPARYVALITIDNPSKRNAMSREMMAELAQLWDRLGDAVRASRYFAEGVAAFREKRQPDYD